MDFFVSESKKNYSVILFLLFSQKVVFAALHHVIVKKCWLFVIKSDFFFVFRWNNYFCHISFFPRNNHFYVLSKNSKWCNNYELSITLLFCFCFLFCFFAFSRVIRWFFCWLVIVKKSLTWIITIVTVNHPFRFLAWIGRGSERRRSERRQAKNFRTSKWSF